MTRETYKAIQSIEAKAKELQERYEADADCLEALDKNDALYEEEAIQILMRMLETKKERNAMLYSVGAIKAMDGGDGMTREDEIKALMADRCTRQEAERHLKKGTIVYECMDDYIDCLADNCLLDLLMEEQNCKTVEEFKTAVKYGKVEDTAAVTVDGHLYVIEYSL